MQEQERTMQTVKQEVEHLLDTLPDDVSFEDVKDAEEIAAFIARDSRFYARSVAVKIIQAGRHLRDMDEDSVILKFRNTAFSLLCVYGVYNLAL